MGPETVDERFVCPGCMAPVTVEYSNCPDCDEYLAITPDNYMQLGAPKKILMHSHADTLPMTPDLIDWFGEIPPLPEDRHLKQHILKNLHRSLTVGPILPFTWCVAVYSGPKVPGSDETPYTVLHGEHTAESLRAYRLDGSMRVFRVDGKHSLYLLKKYPELFRLGMTCWLSVYECSTPLELKSLYFAHNAAGHHKTTADVVRGYTAGVLPYQRIKSERIKNAISSFLVAYYNGSPTLVITNASHRGGLLIDNVPFSLWYNEICQGVYRPSLGKVPVGLTMLETYLIDVDLATEFWSTVTGDIGSSMSNPANALGKSLEAWFGATQKSAARKPLKDDVWMYYATCHGAWNNWMDGKQQAYKARKSGGKYHVLELKKKRKIVV